MTVCIGAICEGPRIVGAADRMLTAGDIEFEPQIPKIIPLTTSIVLMMAGDASLNSQIVSGIRENIQSAIRANPNQWISVREAAEWYRLHYRDLVASQAERDVLWPLGLDRSSFIARQHEMQSDFIQRTADTLMNFRFNTSVEAIVTGIDIEVAGEETSFRRAHLYVINEGDIYSQATVGFGGIGIGRQHAESQFMFAGFNNRWSMQKTLLLVHAAKKRSEVSPGVGKATDVFIIGPAPGSFFTVGDHVLTELEDNWEQTQKNVAKATAKSEARMMKFDAELARKVKQTAGSQSQGTPSPPSAGQEGNAETSSRDQT